MNNEPPQLELKLHDHRTFYATVLRCPTCGGYPVLERGVTDQSTSKWRVYCSIGKKHPDACDFPSTGWLVSQARALATWQASVRLADS